MADSRTSRAPARPLHKASSLVLNTPADARVPAALGPKERASQDEIIPDSEEERIRLTHGGVMRVTRENGMEVIEISSDEEHSVVVHEGRPSIHHDVFTDDMPGGWKTSSQDARRDDSSSESDSIRQPTPRAPKLKGVQTPRSRRIIQSSSSESDADVKPASPPQLQKLAFPRTPARSIRPVVDLTLSSPDRGRSDDDDVDEPTTKPRGRVPRPMPKPRNQPPSATKVEDEASIPLYADDDDDDDDDALDANDGSILTFDEPRSARKPIRHTPSLSQDAGPSIPHPRAPVPVRALDSSSSDNSAVQTPRSPATTARRGARAPRLTKKALAAAEQARREAYARAWFDRLNAAVFEGGIPAGTQLVWSKRLLTTAGRAKWHKSRDGTQTTEIELAVKILDCDERIRNTLSHEMCHLACWIINGDPKEGHGKTFHGWAAKVMRARPEIHISTKHSYDITYKFEWKCEKCGKIYGRHSKSIRPDECVCGACRVGKLIPLFANAPRTPKAPKDKADSQMAAARSRDSPVAVPASAAAEVGGARPGSIALEDASDDSDIEVIARVLGGVRIADRRP